MDELKPAPPSIGQEEIKARITRLFEAHLPANDRNELHPKFVTDDRGGIISLVDAIDGFVLGRLKNGYTEDGTENPGIIKLIDLLRWFCTRFRTATDDYQSVYNEFLKVRAECWKIIHQDSV